MKRPPIDCLQAGIERFKARGWHIQIYTSLAMISAVKDLVAAAPMPIVFDHFGGAAQPAPGMDGGCGDPQEDPGRQSGPALRVLSAGA